MPHDEYKGVNTTAIRIIANNLQNPQKNLPGSHQNLIISFLLGTGIFNFFTK